MTFENITFDSIILETDEKQFHQHRLKVVSENLKEFNKRNSDEPNIQYKYHSRKAGYFGENYFVFDRINETDGYPHYSDSYFTPDWFVYISQCTDKFEEWTNHYCNRVYENFEKFRNLYGPKEIDLFLKLFKDFYPQGRFLNTEQIESFKKEINIKCKLAESYKPKN